MASYQVLRELGRGGFGTVYEARNLHTGRLMAVKVISSGSNKPCRRAIRAAYVGECVTLPTLNHPHIIRTFGSSYWETPHAEVYLELMEGTLQDLALLHSTDCRVLASDALNQMLQALEYLRGRGLVHRDVKPENIFYTASAAGSRGPPPPLLSPAQQHHHHHHQQQQQQQSPWTFRLGDFGLCERASEVSRAGPRGSWPYFAPELFAGHPQTHKSDVWALYVTVLWTLDVGSCRAALRHCGGGTSAAAGFARALAEWGQYGPPGSELEVLGWMSKADPDERASAGQILAWWS